jgi:hypothetical protein
VMQDGFKWRVLVHMVMKSGVLVCMVIKRVRMHLVMKFGVIVHMVMKSGVLVHMVIKF